MPPCSALSTNQEPAAPAVIEPADPVVLQKPKEKTEFKPQIVWVNVGFILILHLMALYGIWLLPQIKFLTFPWMVLCHIAGAMGVTVGAHRLWSHKSYKAAWPFRLVMMLFNSMAAQNDIFEWSRDHRVHHKYSETDADPHNAARGFFFSHVGWLMQRKHPDVIIKGKGIDLSDLYEDEIVMFQKRHYKKISLFMCVAFPMLVTCLWGESLWNSYFTAFALRYIFTLNATWCVNSVAHFWGDRPYDVTIHPAENSVVTTLTIGEGYHNYHHTFPQDYAASEYGTTLNLSTKVIDMCASLGLVSDRKKMTEEMIRKRMTRTGALRHCHAEGKKED